MPATTQNTAVSGWATVLGAAKEATFATASTTGEIYLPFTQAQIEVQNKTITRTPVRRSKAEALPGFGLVDVSGSIDTSVDPDSIGLFAALALGSDTATAVPSQTGAYSHLIKLGAQSTATIQADYGKNSVAQYLGCKFSSMDLSCKPGEDLTAKFQFAGQTVNLLASQSLSPTYTNNTFFEWAFIQSVTIDGATVDITDFTVSLKNDNKAMYTSTSGRLARGFNELGSAVSGTFTYPYKDDTINAMLWGGSSGPVNGAAATGHTLVIPFQHPTLIASTTAHYALTITLNNVVLLGAPIPVQAKGEVMQQVKFSASESNPGASDALTLTIVNTAASAYV
jgi:Phage tail tube protein